MDTVKVTIIGVSRQERQNLKVACLRAGTSISAEMRARLPRIIDEIEGRVMSYDALKSLLMGVTGVLNLALAGRDAQARAALDELNGELQRFKHQLHDEMHRR